jgi:hypothetical protein
MDTYDFECSIPGENSYAIRATGLLINGTVTINGNADLSSVIKFNDGGCVYGITLTQSPGFYDYVLNVDAQGPKGPFSGSGYLAFTDKEPDCYKLSIYSSRRSTHTLRYDSQKPDIIKIQWNNYSI